MLRDITMTIAEGESVGILGHNGMGKTTLLRTLIGALRSTGGSITLDGADITNTAPHVRVKLGMAYVPQGREIFPTLSTLDNLRMGLVKTGALGHGGGAGTIDQLLQDFPRLKPLLDRPGGSLSGGEQQLLALARALAGQPTMLLLDEPTASLDAANREVVLTLIEEAKARGAAILGIFHDEAARARICDRLVDVTGFTPRAAA